MLQAGEPVLTESFSLVCPLPDAWMQACICPVTLDEFGFKHRLSSGCNPDKLKCLLDGIEFGFF